MNCRRVLNSDYEMLSEWWIGHGWPAVKREVLPFGLICEKDGKPLSAGFLYLASNAPVAYLEYLVTDPENSARDSYKAIDMVLEELTAICRYNMIVSCFARISQDSLAKLYEKHDFIVCDTVKDLIWNWRA